MLCDDCKKQPAVVHLTQIVNGQKSELHLCFVCANQRNIQILPILGSISPGFAPAIQTSSPTGHENRACEQCRYKWREFTATGFLGCTKCYLSFADLIAPLIAKNFGPIRHQGKYPQRGGGAIQLRRNISVLRSELEKAVAAEDFEKAAQLRDQIRELEQKV